MFQIHTKHRWEDFEKDSGAQEQLLNGLPELFRQSRWFGGKAYHLSALRVDHCLPLQHGSCTYYFLIVEASYEDHTPEYYLIPLSLTAGLHERIIASYTHSGGTAFLMDAIYDPGFHQALFHSILENRDMVTSEGQLEFDRGIQLQHEERYEHSRTPVVDQSNSCIVYNERYFMKLYRKLFLNTNPEVEMLKFLTEQGKYNNVPAYAGSLIWSRKKTPPVTFALMMNKVDAQKDSWVSTGDELNDFLHAFIHGDFSIHEFVFEQVELLARRTAEMHLALSTSTRDKAFVPEKFTPEYREWLYTHLVSLLKGRLQLIDRHKDLLDDEAREMADQLRKKQKLILQFFEQIRTKPLKSLRTRIHGDYHLGQILFHHQDYIIIDFEGEPESSIEERKIKHSPIKDVAGIVRSFHYAVSAKLYFSHETKNTDSIRLGKASERWYKLISDTFWNTYSESFGKDNKIYASKSEINFLFLLHLLEKAIYEIGYELNGRPHWLKIPLKGIEQVIHELEKYEG